MKNSTFKIAAAVTLLAVLILFTFYAGDYVNLDPDMTGTLIGVFPGLAVTIVGMLTLATQKLEIYAIPGFGAIGIGLAILLHEMNSLGIIVDDFISSGYSLLELQALVIIIGILMGGAVASTELRR